MGGAFEEHLLRFPLVFYIFDQSFQVSKLHEGNEYFLRVMAENSVGVGNPIETPTSIEVKSPYGKKIHSIS